MAFKITVSSLSSAVWFDGLKIPGPSAVTAIREQAPQP